MQTPILDFLWLYSEDNVSRFHMPGHKGKDILGMEKWDITEVQGADSLYEAKGIIAASEKNATELFGSKHTFYSTEGSSQCIRAMLHLLLSNRGDRAPIVLAARNAHKAFVYSAALLDFEIRWLWPEEMSSLCSCPVSAASLEKTLAEMPKPPAAVYITSPDYLGNMADIATLAEVCHRYGTFLAVDNAHGAYLHFLDKAVHPLDLGADICCDSAHKTLPVLTGGAYLHISVNLPGCFVQKAKNALALFGSTSPSYLTLASLDHCNRYIAGGYREKLADFIRTVDWLKTSLRSKDWQVEESDPLRLCLCSANAQQLYKQLRERGLEAEYADDDYIVFMFTPENDERELELLLRALSSAEPAAVAASPLKLPDYEPVMSVREAVMAESELICVDDAAGRVCASPMVSCPPAIPIVISGERINPEAVALFKRYGIDKIEVVKEA